jgi:hypothetical protein
MSALFHLTDDIRALDALIEELGGELGSPEVAAAWEAMVRELQQDEGVKLDSYVNWIRSLEMEASAAKAEAEQYAMKARVRENRISWLKANLKAHLEATGRAKVLTATKRTLAIQANGGNVPVIKADSIDPAAVPDDLVIIRREIDWEAVRKLLLEGATLPFASLGERGSHLRIR